MRAAAAVAAITKQRRNAKISRSLAYRLGARMGEGPWDGHVVTGGPITLDLRDHGHRQIFFFGQIEPHVTALVRQRFEPGWTVLDVGANAGYYSVLCSDLGARQVTAFEPNPRLHPLLERTAAQHPVMSIEKTAVGEAPGIASLQISPEPGNTGLSTLGYKWEQAATVEVAVVTLDSYCAEHGSSPEFIKVDVEGHEEHVLAGMMGLVARRVPRIVLCELTSRRADPVAVVSRFREAGYDAHAMSPAGSLVNFEHGAARDDVCFTRRP